MQVKKEQLELDTKQQTGSEWGKEYVKAIYILSLCLFNLYAEYIKRNAGLDKAQGGIKIAERNINNLRYSDNTNFMEERKEELKSLLMRVKESEKTGLNLTFKKLRSWHPFSSLHVK